MEMRHFLIIEEYPQRTGTAGGEKTGDLFNVLRVVFDPVTGVMAPVESELHSHR